MLKISLRFEYVPTIGWAGLSRVSIREAQVALFLSRRVIYIFLT